MTDDADTQPIRPWVLIRETQRGTFSLFQMSESLMRSPVSATEHSFLRLDPPEWINVVAVTDEGSTILVEQYRHGVNKVCLEIPGGVVDPAEDPAVAARRELEEETGYISDSLHLIGVVTPNPAFQSNRCFTFLALGCRPEGTVHLDPAEELAVRLVPLSHLTQLIDNQTIQHSLVVAAHDHLQRGIRRGEPWAATLAPWL